LCRPFCDGCMTPWIMHSRVIYHKP
jgi:hypothetical protein